MSAPDPAFDQLVSAGPIVDNASTRLYAIGELEPDWETCPDCNGDCMTTVTRERPGFLDEDVDIDCGTCGATGRLQDTGDLDDRCTDCGREDSHPQCFDYQVRDSYVGGLAPRFGAQP